MTKSGVIRIWIDLEDDAQLERAVEEFLLALDDDVYISWAMAQRIVRRYLPALSASPVSTDGGANL
jgi:hypothetical protein